MVDDRENLIDVEEDGLESIHGDIVKREASGTNGETKTTCQPPNASRLTPVR